LSGGQTPSVLITDARAIAYVLQTTEIYEKPLAFRRALAQMLGAGVLVAEGETHRIQRKALNPAFGAVQIRELTGIMLDKANEVRHAPSSTCPTLSAWNRCVTSSPHISAPATRRR
jgi:cytochrome P450